MNKPKTADQKYKPLIIAVSIVIPLVVGALFRVRIPNVDLSFFPPIYATINGLTAVALVLAVVAIKKGKRELHRKYIRVCILFSLSFLLMYVLYHMTSHSTYFGDTDGNGFVDAAEQEQVGVLRLVYIVILMAHIGLSMIIIPFVLFTYVRALAEKFDKHRKLARITFPMWLFVAVSGVVVYLMISPYMGIRRKFVEENGENIEQVDASAESRTE